MLKYPVKRIAKLLLSEFEGNTHWLESLAISLDGFYIEMRRPCRDAENRELVHVFEGGFTKLGNSTIRFILF